ncbi:hypothetical protein [uncultured Dokdonia sp.]|uniref:hypothetical protein n=1 Tax=uncultured Dokdonia sp. TaxID=575653 RepID=UPI00262D37E7|nr:hypothetical protein [uncultured Dokdonia sp.]
MKLLHLITFFLCTYASAYAQQDFIKVAHNEVLGTLTFIATASNQPGSAPSYQKYIKNAIGNDTDFTLLTERFSAIDVETSIHREHYPEKRHPFTSTMDLLWIASANSTSIDDFATRTIGYLPPNEHTELVAIMHKVLPYYRKHVWATTTTQRAQLEQSIQNYVPQIETLFNKVNVFLGSNWSKTTPFNIMLYPIPLKSGGTTAIPKGNNLICSYLSEREKEGEDIIGIAIHEMNHILFDAQPLELQQDIDTWFTTSSNPYAALAYDFFDEGLATAVGNGWAHEQLNGTLDPGEWYSFEYINGYGKKLYPLVKTYMETNKTIDKAFIEKAIVLFGEAFPKATTDLDILMNNLNIFSQTEDETLIDVYFAGVRERFRMHSAYFSSPIDSEESFTRLRENNRTKLIVIDKDQDHIVAVLQKQFPTLPKNIHPNTSFVTSFYDTKTQSTIVIANCLKQEDYAPLMDQLKAEKYITYGKILRLK